LRRRGVLSRRCGPHRARFFDRSGREGDRRHPVRHARSSARVCLRHGDAAGQARDHAQAHLQCVAGSSHGARYRP